jgi:hypothetical protein
MPSLDKAQRDLAEAIDKWAVLEEILVAAQTTKEEHARDDRDAILKAIKKRDPARLKVMKLQNTVAELAGDQALRIGENGGK